MWPIHILEYYSALKRKTILTHATTWMNLEDIMLSEINQTEKDNCLWFHLYEEPRVTRFLETESRRVDARGWERKNWEFVFNLSFTK